MLLLAISAIASLAAAALSPTAEQDNGPPPVVSDPGTLCGVDLRSQQGQDHSNGMYDFLWEMCMQDTFKAARKARGNGHD